MSSHKPGVTQNAYAKINLCLEIIGKRTDNYHDITSVMQMVDLHDTLDFAEADGITAECDDPALAEAGDDNLVMRAARLLMQEAGVERGAAITLHKRIPVAAGLGGGSSDAAATLRGLSELWGVRPAPGDLVHIAAQLGSDVPFFLNGPTALVEGRGERVTRVPSPPPGWVVLLCPTYDLKDKTRQLYGSLARQDMTDGLVTRRLIAALVAGEFPRTDLMYNAFERAAGTVFEGLDRLRYTMHRASGRDVHLSGSGPTLFALYPARDEPLARKLHEKMADAGMRAYLAATLR
ncbi:MAG TPA: 4-(cytidine 5'-diphospho)-2-C-methyl-D-erythritol kinase [Chloroflexia bacterium]|nr:4-(cytidine 5'-diphospho)-2-C-methyl-D-erythritol kinase [Chloroflexia bacterium]